MGRKIETTMKAICNNWNKVFRAGYCDLQYIMKYEDAAYYNAGVYGWNCDVYVHWGKDIAITTGYRNMRGRTIPSEIIKKYSDIAKEICKDTWSKPYDEIKAALDQNRENFWNELAAL